MTTIAVFLHRKDLVYAKNGELNFAYSTGIKQGGRYMRLHELKAIEIDGEIVVYIVWKFWFLLLRRRLDLPKLVHDAIVNYLHNLHHQRDMFYDCLAFVNSCFGQPQHTGGDIEKFWEFMKLEREPQPGEAIILASYHDDLWEFEHAAICLERRVYVSVYGGAGDIEFSSLDQMKKGYQTTDVFLATPRKNPAAE